LLRDKHVIYFTIIYLHSTFLYPMLEECIYGYWWYLF